MTSVGQLIHMDDRTLNATIQTFSPAAKQAFIQLASLGIKNYAHRIIAQLDDAKNPHLFAEYRATRIAEFNRIIYAINNG